ncbi:DUF2584 family protein [Bacillus sp. 165]|uniref:DUF2584 family protein n=1 Tax=Bacillus sp. 165 TaxID=1529117 RepID=UPI001AD9C029|nr:DUF2584 family protein [Bacillus sp. 165]MBO9129291.1 DUF2584 family protein [Bacillus sp. 165]
MKFEMHTNIVSFDKEIRMEGEHNQFELTLQGYHLFPIEQPLNLYKTEKELTGTAVVKAITWKQEHTEILYQLISLHSVN